MSSLTRFRELTQSPRYRVFLFPFAGGNAVFYHPWVTLFPDDIDLVAIQLPGHGNRFQETPLRCMDAIITLLLEEIESQLDIPYLFFGHSMGSVIAYQVALNLREKDLPMPEHMFLSGRRAPQLTSSSSPERHELPQHELLNWAISTGGFPQELLAHQDMVDMFMGPLSADMEALELWQRKFRLSSPLFVPFTVYSGSTDPEVTWEEVQPWIELSGLQSRSHLFDGGHFYLKEQASVIADEILNVISTSTV